MNAGLTVALRALITERPELAGELQLPFPYHTRQQPVKMCSKSSFGAGGGLRSPQSVILRIFRGRIGAPIRTGNHQHIFGAGNETRTRTCWLETKYAAIKHHTRNSLYSVFIHC